MSVYLVMNVETSDTNATMGQIALWSGVLQHSLDTWGDMGKASYYTSKWLQTLRPGHSHCVTWVDASDTHAMDWFATNCEPGTSNANLRVRKADLDSGDVSEQWNVYIASSDPDGTTTTAQSSSTSN